MSVEVMDMTEQRRRQIENSFKTLSEAALYAIDAEFRANGDTVLEAMTQAEICRRAREGFDRIRRTRDVRFSSEVRR